MLYVRTVQESELTMSNETAAPGWYPAEGDPPNTTRWWNGTSWVGDPHAVDMSQPPVSFPSAPPGHLDRVDGDLSPLGWVLFALQRWNVVNARARRREYWWLVFAYLIGLVSLMVPGLLLAETGSNISTMFIGLMLAFIVVMVVPMWTATIRRLHDTGRSGWWILLGAIPVVNNIGSLVLLVFHCLDSEPGTNQWGPSPKHSLVVQDLERAHAAPPSDAYR